MAAPRVLKACRTANAYLSDGARCSACPLRCRLSALSGANGKVIENSDNQPESVALTRMAPGLPRTIHEDCSRRQNGGLHIIVRSHELEHPRRSCSGAAVGGNASVDPLTQVSRSPRSFTMSDGNSPSLSSSIRSRVVSPLSTQIKSHPTLRAICLSVYSRSPTTTISLGLY